MVGLAGSIGSGLLSAAASIASQGLSMQMQRGLNRSQYDDFINAGRSLGMTPAALAQGLSKGPSSMPSSPVGQVGAGDIGNVASSIMDSTSNAALRDEERRNKIKEGKLMDLELFYKPKQWFADINKTWSEVYANKAKANLDKGLLGYYNELKSSVVQKRPWEIGLLKQGLINAQEEANKIISDYKLNYQKINESKASENLMKQEKMTSMSQEFLNYQLAYESENRSNYLKEEKYLIIGKRAEQEFYNNLRKSGWDPSAKPFDNVARLIITNPEQFNKFMDTSIQSLQILDNKLMDNLGKNYKRNIAVGVGLHYLNNRIGQYKNDKATRFNLLTGSIGNLIPLAKPTPASFPSKSPAFYLNP